MDDDQQFQARIDSAIATVRAWEDVDLFRRIRSSLPWEDLASEGGASSLSEPRRDVLLTSTNLRCLQRLARHFKASMTWVNQPPCENFNCPIGNSTSIDGTPMTTTMEYVTTRGPETDEEREGRASRVEVYVCRQCQSRTTFPRYNRASKIFETRRGRCGEYANLFGAYCRAMGLEARYVTDFTDHVWTECHIQGGWVMVDSCEGVVNEPSMYEAGWGKKLNYVLAVSTTDVVDVTPRYTRQFYTDDFQSRRRAVTSTELAGENLVRRSRQLLQKSLKPKQVEEVSKRLAAEESHLSACRNSTDWEGDTYDRGRISGSYAWKVSRSEAGSNVDDSGTQSTSKDSKSAHSDSSAYQLAVETYCPTMLNADFSVRIVPHPTASRHDAIRVGGTSCAVGSYDPGKPHLISVVVVDDGEAMLGCIVQSRSFGAMSTLVAFLETVPTGRIVALHGLLPRDPSDHDKNDTHVKVVGAEALMKQLPGIVAHHLYEGIMFIGQVRLKSEWSQSHSFDDAPSGIEAIGRAVASTTAVERQCQQLRLRTCQNARPRTVVGRLDDSIMALDKQLMATHDEKRRAFLSWEDARTACAGYVTHPGGPVYLLGRDSFPLEEVPEEQWVTFLWLPPPLVSVDDVGIVEPESASQTNSPAEFNVPLETSFFTTHLGHEVLSSDGSTVDTETALRDARLVGLYYSAHWCGPCRSFTPMLAELYLTLKESHPTHGLEIIFVSSDRDLDSFNNYFRSMPWMALPISSPLFAGYKQQLSALYGVRGIPALVVLDAMSGQVVVSTSESRAEVVNACSRGDNAIEAMFLSWMERLPTETKELASMLALSVVEDNAVSTPASPTPSSQEDPSGYLRRLNATDSKEDASFRVQSKFRQLVDEHGMAPNAAAAKAIGIASGQLSHMPVEMQVARISTNEEFAPQSLNSHLREIARSERTNVAVSTALKYLENVRNEPWNPKFRQFKLSNKVADRLFPILDTLTHGSAIEVIAVGSDFHASISICANLDEVANQLRLLIEGTAASE